VAVYQWHVGQGASLFIASRRFEVRPGSSGGAKNDISWVGFVANVIHFTYKL